ncbi:hypothetical protein CC1G_12424 [Coprinopsis cinerea okayama7|uniref:Arrestin-like N-terminal domain-containing protein n=1 Tax=Coprinopsis cinerea (strain Okayama-7 / 130 / ATCC MYA-4618 / FGSC 9003) TaxID=240176 RepID=A8P6G6_COPC7|nr:hypothetical protein CC1G_12424 [Coprinopsis cinerea okayama7\|eukprot:XP_001839152.1 hypothetical protein CC1G_12424 [Coprinopsis cinerea okayama7\
MATSRMPYSNSQHPPRYSTLSLNSVATLPLYPAADYDIADSTLASSVQDSYRQHEYHLYQDSRPWATLRLVSKSTSKSNCPRYITGDDVTGTVELDLPEPQAISSVKVLLKGHLVTSSLSTDTFQFVEHSVVVWEKGHAMNQGKAPESTSNGKLHGRFEWPFSFPFPTEYPRHGPSKSKGSSSIESTTDTIPTPQTLIEKTANIAVVYEVVLRIVSGVFRRRYKLHVDVLYVPAIRSLPMSTSRKDAYLRGAHLPGPVEDMEGWTEVPSARFTLVRRQVETGASARSGLIAVPVNCQLYIAHPAAYAKGTTIPCYLVCTSDSDEIDLVKDFTTRQCLAMELRQSWIYTRDAQHARSVDVPEITRSGKANPNVNQVVARVGEAVWWTPVHGGYADRRRGVETRLEGEIHLERDLFPSCETSFLCVQYNISIALRDSQDFVVKNIETSEGVSSSTATSNRTCLGTYPVKITTLGHMDDPLPTCFTPRHAGRRSRKGYEQISDVHFLSASPLDVR